MATDDDKTFDVAKPGNTPADATARPIITPRTILKDPMVAGAETADAAPKPATAPETLLAGTAKKVESKTEAPPPVQEAQAPQAEAPTAKAPEEGTAESSEETESKAAASAKKAKPQEIAEETARREATQKLIESKQYHVAIKQPKRQRSAKWLLIGVLVILLLLIGADLAIDAGLIKTSIKPPINLIKS